MCGHFTQRDTWREIHDLYDLTGSARNLQAHYNIAPTDTVDVVKLANGGTTELVSMRWGLIPYWWKKPLKQLPATFNARAEGIANKPTFRMRSNGIGASFRPAAIMNGLPSLTASSRTISALPTGAC
jgi:putative SOS response-associated peptidase YedK